VRARASARLSVRPSKWLSVCMKYETGVWATPYSNIRVDVADILTREIDTKLFAVEFCGILRC